MAAKVIDGVAVARRIRKECAERVAQLRADHGVVPALAVVIVGEHAPSLVYVRNKMRACEEIGIRACLHSFPVDVSPAIVEAKIAALNADPSVHGILIQLPLPDQFGAGAIVRSIRADKDVDGFHQYNVGGLVIGDTVFPPCTPQGVMRLLQHEGIPIEGKNVVVVGASNIVGKPLGLMLLQREATVSICHAKTRDLAQYTILADILVIAAGCPNLITAPMVKTGAVVIDVGINRLPSGRLVGDVDFDNVRSKASYITPVPGGVGPMTISMLLANTIDSARRHAAAAQQSYHMDA